MTPDSGAQNLQAGSPAATPGRTGPRAADPVGFAALYRESLAQVSPSRRPDPAEDVRAVARDFMNVERLLNSERVRMFDAFLPRGSASGVGPLADPATRAAIVARAGGAALPEAPMAGGVARGQAFAGALARDSDRPGAQPLFTDAATTMVPGAVPGVVQQSLGLPDGSDPHAIDFATEISRLGNHHAALMDEIRNATRRVGAGGSFEETLRAQAELHGLVAASSDVATQKNVLANLYLGVYDEARTKTMVVVDLVQGALNKLNQLFNQLKASS